MLFTPFLRVTALFCLVVAAPLTAQAKTVTVEFWGEVVELKNNGGPVTTTSIAVGDAVHGKFTYDLTPVAVSPGYVGSTRPDFVDGSGSRTNYLPGPFGASTTFELSIGEYEWIGRRSTIYLYVADDYRYLENEDDRTDIFLSAPSSIGPTVDGASNSGMSVGFGDINNPSLLSSSAALPDLGEMQDLLSANPDYWDRNGIFLSNGDIIRYGVTDAIASVSAVPLPATLPLLLAAFGGLGLARRRKTA
ncbi:VPLPA-CTERM sorting domain-containing protein [Actibacterium lipolyticum]|uniref:VPLPA-CTERM protein sorting domain-containing protein n=1 Tax=Actibacterium lipolyticum TaxID=1524263 RepID=A0A238JWU0_9RHOB|nr:VPLPA-CTERM sorting domain-containing protein [Actibacterium lipolyticum]SMX34634.1 hypothetical protein COL8621_01408 [Actibacterium lipolyticum]